MNPRTISDSSAGTPALLPGRSNMGAGALPTSYFHCKLALLHSRGFVLLRGSMPDGAATAYDPRTLHNVSMLVRQSSVPICLCTVTAYVLHGALQVGCGPAVCRALRARAVAVGTDRSAITTVDHLWPLRLILLPESLPQIAV